MGLSSSLIAPGFEITPDNTEREARRSTADMSCEKAYWLPGSQKRGMEKISNDELSRK
jgi:hypothetical protein